MKAKIYNVKLPVLSLDQSVSFYREVFSFLGFNEGTAYDDPIDGKTTMVFGNGHLYLELVEDPNLVPSTDLASIAGPRIEFLAESKDQVNAFYKHLLGSKAPILSSPQNLFDGLLGPNESWYSVYFADPNGIKYGLVYTR